VIEELVVDEGLQVTSCSPFKGDMDCERLAACIERYTPAKVAFVRVEAGTNLIGGQPFSLQNLRDVREVRAWQSQAGLGMGAASRSRAGQVTGSIIVIPDVHGVHCASSCACSIFCACISGASTCQHHSSGCWHGHHAPCTTRLMRAPKHSQTHLHTPLPAQVDCASNTIGVKFIMRLCCCASGV
jgi:hypothetical protein